MNACQHKEWNREGEKRVGNENKKCFFERIMVKTQTTSLWSEQKPPMLSFVGHIWGKGLFRTMLDSTEIKIYHHTGCSSVSDKVQVASSMYLCIFPTKTVSIWAFAVGKKTKNLCVHRGSVYISPVPKV